MNTLFKYILSFFAVAVFLTVTSGFTVYTHFCSSSSIKQQSIIESHIVCEHTHKISKLNTTHDNNAGCDTGCCTEMVTDKCCSNKKEYCKMNEVFLLPSFTVDSKDFSTYVITIKLYNIDFNVEEFFKQSESTFSLPPPLSGKQIVVLYHQLKTEPNLFA